MYYDTRDKHGFLASEQAGLKAARDCANATSMYACAAWNRADADSLREVLRGDDAAWRRAVALRERYRVAHREAVALKDEVAALDYDMDGDEYGDSDMDEYGYAA